MQAALAPLAALRATATTARRGQGPRALLLLLLDWLLLMLLALHEFELLGWHLNG